MESRRWDRALSMAVLLVIFALLAVRSMGLELDHDEHQFIAGGALLARRGLLPYRDYPYFHTPYLVFVDALLFRTTNYLLLAARGLSAACGALMVWLVFRHARKLTASLGYDPSRSTMAALGGALVLLTNPLFLTADGLAWNHDPAELLMMGAVLLMLWQIGRSAAAGALMAAGALVGAAIGVRLTSVTAAAAIFGFLLANPETLLRRRLSGAGWFTCGLALALLPLAWMYARAPQQFLFGNFDYPQLNTAWRAAGIHQRDATPLGKILVFAVVLFAKPGNLAFLLAWILFFLPRRPHTAQAGHPMRRQLNFLVIVILFLLAGSFAAAPTFSVYFYAPVPFVILWLMYWILPLVREPPAARRAWASAAMLAVAVVVGCPDYLAPIVRLRPSTWIPVRAHRLGEDLARRTGAGSPVLTLAPIFPLEGGLDIYETYATGPFAMRVSAMVPEDREQSLRLIDPEDLPNLFRRRPPQAMLGGLEGDTEAPLVKVAGAYAGCKFYMLPEHWQTDANDTSLEPLRRRGNKPK